MGVEEDGEGVVERGGGVVEEDGGVVKGDVDEVEVGGGVVEGEVVEDEVKTLKGFGTRRNGLNVWPSSCAIGLCTAGDSSTLSSGCPE